MATASRDIFALPGELSRAILAITGANEGNLVLNTVILGPSQSTVRLRWIFSGIDH